AQVSPLQTDAVVDTHAGKEGYLFPAKAGNAPVPAIGRQPGLFRANPPARSRQKAVLAAILSSYFMIVVDISIVIAGLPRIRAELGFSTTDLSWVQNAYTLAFGGLL